VIVERIWTGNALRNFNYIIACPETGEALAIDPLDFNKCLAVVEKRGWTVTQIFNTHEHSDHIGGNKAMAAATGASIIAHAGAASRIPNIDRAVGAGDVIKVGKTVELECLDTPGHTMTHICLLSHTDQPALFSGDTLFNAGAGNCYHGGHPQQLYDTFNTQLQQLPKNTQIFPGHDYLLANLQFTLDREPDNQVARDMHSRYADQDPANCAVTTLEQEMEINTFFRLQSPTVIQRLQESFPAIGDDPSPRDVFVKLRELRNDW